VARPGDYTGVIRRTSIESYLGVEPTVRLFKHSTPLLPMILANFLTPTLHMR
jgi:hypothetical protein